MFPEGVFIGGAEQLLAREGRLVRCSVRNVYSGGRLAVSRSRQAGSLTPACSSMVPGWGVLSSSRAGFPACKRWKRPRWRRKNLKNVSTHFFPECLSVHSLSTTFCGEPAAPRWVQSPPCLL